MLEATTTIIADIRLAMCTAMFDELGTISLDDCFELEALNDLEISLRHFKISLQNLLPRRVSPLMHLLC